MTILGKDVSASEELATKLKQENVKILYESELLEIQDSLYFLFLKVNRSRGSCPERRRLIF